MIDKLKSFFINTYKQILTTSILLFIEVVIVGLGQIILDYGSIRVYALCFVLGVFHFKIYNFILRRF